MKRTLTEGVGELSVVEGNGPKRERVRGYCILSSYLTCTAQETLFELGTVEGIGLKRESDRILYIEQLLDLYCSRNIIRVVKLKIGWACGTNEGEAKYIRHNEVDLQGKRPHRRPGCRWEDINYGVMTK
jgi:hypothetical protein